MLARRLRRRANIEPALDHRFVFARISVFDSDSNTDQRDGYRCCSGFDSSLEPETLALDRIGW